MCALPYTSGLQPLLVRLNASADEIKTKKPVPSHLNHHHEQITEQVYSSSPHASCVKYHVAVKHLFMGSCAFFVLFLRWVCQLDRLHS